MNKILKYLANGLDTQGISPIPDREALQTHHALIFLNCVKHKNVK